MRVLITGGAGFIGSNLARRALLDGWDVTILDDLSTGYIDNITGMDLKFVEGSLLDRDAVDSALEGVEAIVHLAALGSVPRSIGDPLRTHAVNATGTLNLLEASRRHGISYLVASSSSSVYGLNPALPKDEREWVRPVSPYAVSKLAAEQYVLAYQQSFGLNTLAFRFFNVFGPGQRANHPYAAVIPIFLNAAIHDLPLPVFGDGSNSRDFTFVGTVCDVLLQAVVRRVCHPEPVNLGFGTDTSLNEVIQAIGEITGSSPKIRYSSARTGDVAHSKADNRMLRMLFPNIGPVPLKDGLMEAYKWLNGDVS